jgi:hypothetical protein
MMRITPSVGVILRAFTILLPIGMVHGDIIPPSRLFNWQAGINVGIPGGIPTDRINLIDVTRPPYNADNTGVTNAAPAINLAITAASAGTIIYLPAGTYRVEGLINISMKSNITLRGAGAATVLGMRTSGGAAFMIGGDTEWPWDYSVGGASIVGGLTQGSQTLTLSSTSAFSVGDIAILSESNDYSLPVVHVSGGNRSRQQKSQVTSKTDSTITVSPPLFWTLDANRSPKAHVLRARVSGVGIEDLTIDLTNSSSAYGAWFDQAVHCWIKNVSVQKTSSFGIFLLDCFQSEVRHCDIRDRKTQGSNGAGILVERSTACLIEDNIIYKIFPHIEVNFNSCGNVFAFNFCEVNDVFGIMGACIDSNHGPHNHFNLYEGNVASKFQSDGYFGSASDDTVFRNWFHGTSDTTDQFGICIYLNRFTRNYNLVGNILGRSGKDFLYDNNNGNISYQSRYIFALGLPNMGNGESTGTAQLSHGDDWADGFTAPWPGANGFQELDLDVAATTLRKGNWNARNAGIASIETLASEETLPPSLFRSSKPAWFGNRTWPPFDPYAPDQNYDAIPAGYRYVNGIDPPSVPKPPSNLRVSP